MGSTGNTPEGPVNERLVAYWQRNRQENIIIMDASTIVIMDTIGAVTATAADTTWTRTQDMIEKNQRRGTHPPWRNNPPTPSVKVAFKALFF